jgi:flavodoxin I
VRLVLRSRINQLILDNEKPEEDIMKALIVVDSVYGNTEKIAKAIAGGLSPVIEVKVVRPGEVTLADLGSINLLIVGSPVQAGKQTKAIQEFLNKIPADSLKNVRVAAFDTRVKAWIAKVFGYAAGRIAESLKEKGGTLAAQPEGFIVKGRQGPLEEGEVERATAWAKAVSEKS